jgi:hypothetical protein
MDKVTDLANVISVSRSERVWHELEMLALFRHCQRSHEAVRSLLSEGFSHEAVTLGRPLFVNSLALQELAAADEKRRGSLMVGWVLAGIQDLENYFRDRESRGDDVSEEMEQIAERRREVVGYASKRGFGTRHWQPDPKGLADAHGRGHQYGAMLVTHMFVHGTWAATSEHYSITDEGVVVGRSTATPKRWERDAGLFASYSMLLAMRAASRIFGWVEPTELDELLASLASLATGRERPDQGGG